MLGRLALNLTIHLTVLLLFAPLLQGVITKTKALFAGRVFAAADTGCADKARAEYDDQRLE